MAFNTTKNEISKVQIKEYILKIQELLSALEHENEHEVWNNCLDTFKQWIDEYMTGIQNTGTLKDKKIRTLEFAHKEVRKLRSSNIGIAAVLNTMPIGQPVDYYDRAKKLKGLALHIKQYINNTKY